MGNQSGLSHTSGEMRTVFLPLRMLDVITPLSKSLSQKYSFEMYSPVIMKGLVVMCLLYFHKDTNLFTSQLFKYKLPKVR